MTRLPRCIASGMSPSAFPHTLVLHSERCVMTANRPCFYSWGIQSPGCFLDSPHSYLADVSLSLA
jgi:hypothetical protein